jgi:N,N-dimethylformamidase
VSQPYRLAEGARESRAAWVFEGVDGDEFGAHGSVLHGAGGFEIDRVDEELGTPPHALVLATARGFSDVYQATSEDILTADSLQGGTVSPLVRADMVFYERPNGGAVFSTGSIAWCGALLDDDCDNDVSRITETVLRRFSDEGPVN